MANAYVAGNLIRVSSVFTDTNGAVQDAPSVKVTWATDGGTSTTWTYGVNGQLVKDSVGNYHADLAIPPACQAGGTSSGWPPAPARLPRRLSSSSPRSRSEPLPRSAHPNHLD